MCLCCTVRVYVECEKNDTEERNGVWISPKHLAMVLHAPTSAATAEVVLQKGALLLVEGSDADPNEVAARVAQMVGGLGVNI